MNAVSSTLIINLLLLTEQTINITLIEPFICKKKKNIDFILGDLLKTSDRMITGVCTGID